MSIVRSLLATFALLTAVPTANAQISVYGTAMLTNFGLYNDTSSGIAFQGDTAGFGGGAFYNFPIQSRLTAGVDARGSYSPGTKGGASAAGALRIGFVPRTHPLRPYVEIGGGLVSTDAYTYVSNGVQIDTSPHRVTNGALDLLGGLDIRLTHALDLRAIEYGAAAGASATNTRAGFGFLSAGVVYHLRSTRRP